MVALHDDFMTEISAMTARHILTYAQTLDGGGVERAMLRLATCWAAAGRQVTIAIGCADGPLAGELSDVAETIVLGRRGYGALARAVPAIVRDRRPDAIFCPGNHYTGVAAWTRLRLGRRCPPTIAKLSNALARADHGPVARAAYGAWLRAHPRFCDAVVAMSAASAAEAARHMGISREGIAVIANPPATLRAGAAPVTLPPGRYLLGVGRLVAQKRWDRAIAALAALADRDIPLVILGEGPERAALEALAARHGVAHRLLLPGHAGDPLSAMAGAAALVLTSDFEGVPGVLREALSVGTPVVTTDSSVAIPEIVTVPEQGSIVPRGNAAALVAALDDWLAPGRARPVPVIAAGDPAADYLALFDGLAAAS